MKSVISGQGNHQFFHAIQSYFGFDDAASFWNRVVFFNFLPNAVGNKSNEFAKGTFGQLKRRRERFLRIVTAEKPDEVLVFTSKGWRSFPETTVEAMSGRTCKPLIPCHKFPNWGTYIAGDHRVLVCGFRHPLFASGDGMREQVRAFLKLRP